MKKKQLSELKYNKTPISVGTRSKVYLLSNGKILKLYDDSYLEYEKLFCVIVEDKILDSANRDLDSRIKKPEIAVYEGEKFVGEIISPANGVSYANFEERLSYKQSNNLELYANVYTGLESIVRTTPDIIYPDICNYDNIFVSDNGRKIELIDYEGLQVGNYPTLSFSSALGNPNQYNSSSKYCRGIAPSSVVRLYTKELDIRSLIYFYFRTVFNVDLNIVSNHIEYLDDMLQLIEMQTNLKEPDIMHKVWKLFKETEKNEWLGEDVFMLADKYNIETFNNGIKRLVRK